MLKEYRAALTRNLLANNTARTPGAVIPRSPPSNRDLQDRPAYSTVAQMTPLNYDDVLSKKPDQILARVEEESNGRRVTEGVQRFLYGGQQTGSEPPQSAPRSVSTLGCAVERVLPGAGGSSREDPYHCVIQERSCLVPSSPTIYPISLQ